jgi:hypothetical protein
LENGAAGAKVEFHVRELFPRVGFIVTNLSLPAYKLGQAVAPSGAAETNRRLVADELAAAVKAGGRFYEWIRQ